MPDEVDVDGVVTEEFKEDEVALVGVVVVDGIVAGLVVDGVVRLDGVFVLGESDEPLELVELIGDTGIS